MPAWHRIQSVAKSHLATARGTQWLVCYTFSTPAASRCFSAVSTNSLTEEAQTLLKGVSESIQKQKRQRHADQPFVTLTYAQSLDGSIAHERVERLILSSPLSLEFTHHLRSMHDAILVGVGTVLADNPQLTARLPGVERSPLPVILDSQLRTPLSSRLVQNAASNAGLVIATTKTMDREKAKRLSAIKELKGVRVLQVTEVDGTLAVGDVLHAIKEQCKCDSVMIEGGAAVIATFLNSPAFLDQVILTVAPHIVGGLCPSAAPGHRQRMGPSSMVKLRDIRHVRLGEDIIVAGQPEGYHPQLKPAVAPHPDVAVNGEVHTPAVNGHHVNGHHDSGRVASKGEWKEGWVSVNGVDNAASSRGGREVEGAGGLRFLSDCRMWVEAVRAECKMSLYKPADGETEVVALVKGDVEGASDVPVRIHSECFTGDVLGSRRCDCGEQLHEFLSTLDRSTAGVLLYVRGHEGRGIGLANKVRAYKLQEAGQDTVDANLSLGLDVDARTYDDCKGVLKDLGVESIHLYSNNPDKASAMGGLCSKVVPIVSSPQEHNWRYLETKRKRLNHVTILPEVQGSEQSFGSG